MLSVVQIIITLYIEHLTQPLFCSESEQIKLLIKSAAYGYGRERSIITFNFN